MGNVSWLHKDIKSSEVFPSDFTCYRYDLKSEKVRYNSSELSDLKSDDTSEHLWVKLQVKGSPYLCLGSFYKPLKQTEDKCLIHLLNFIH